ncbi:MAG: TonB-dependent receptor, partial [Campylobacterales bacterium]|nr:TonB-dependent receptor [Campylobacterales bacterium]
AGNTDLNPESSKGYEVSLKKNSSSLTYFNNQINDEIIYSGGKYANGTGESNYKGYELGTSYKIDSLDTIFSFHHIDLKATDDKGEKLAKRADTTTTFNIDTYKGKLHVNFNGQYIGDRVEYSYGTYNVSSKTGNYGVFNSAINYNVTKDFQGYIKLDNIGDKKYQVVDGYGTAKRSYYLGLKANF